MLPHEVEATSCFARGCSANPHATAQLLASRQYPAGSCSGADTLMMVWGPDVQKSTKQCPTCKMAIQKAAGCSHMICGSCGTHFCWRCNKSIDGYEHFRAGACILFDEGEIRAWEMQMARLTQAQHDRWEAGPTAFKNGLTAVC